MYRFEFHSKKRLVTSRLGTGKSLTFLQCTACCEDLKYRYFAKWFLGNCVPVFEAPSLPKLFSWCTVFVYVLSLFENMRSLKNINIYSILGAGIFPVSMLNHHLLRSFKLSFRNVYLKVHIDATVHGKSWPSSFAFRSVEISTLGSFAPAWTAPPTQLRRSLIKLSPIIVWATPHP